METDLKELVVISGKGGTGKTSVVVQFIARDQDGYTLAADDVAVEMLVNDLPVDNESILQQDAEELSASIHFGLVLDASYFDAPAVPPGFPEASSSRALVHPMSPASRARSSTGSPSSSGPFSSTSSSGHST